MVIKENTIKNSDVEHDIEAVVLCNYSNSGYHLFQEDIEEDVLKTEDCMIDDLDKQSQTAEDMDRIISSVHKSLGLQYSLKDGTKVCRLITCAVCGIRQFEREEVQYHRVPLSKFPCLKCSPAETLDFFEKKRQLTVKLPCENGSWKKFDLWNLYSRFKTSDELYYLYPQFLEGI